MLKQNNKVRDIIENILSFTELSRRQDETEKKINKVEQKLDNTLEILTEKTIQNGCQDKQIDIIQAQQEKNSQRLIAVEKATIKLTQYIEIQEASNNKWFNRNTTFYIMVLGWAFTIVMLVLKP